MLRKYFVSLALLGCTLSELCYAFEREVAITIDDLPFVGSAYNSNAKLQREQNHFMRIMQALVDNNVPATGFVIAGNIERGQWQMLEYFQQSGFTLGNHTYTHISLNSTSADKYIANIDKADKVLAPLMTNTKYFRYPYLAEGKGDKRKKVQRYLASSNYVIAPVTIDSKDFVFNKKIYRVPKRLREQKIAQLKQSYLNYIWKQTLLAEKYAKNSKEQSAKQILLIHANLLNSYLLSDVIELFRQNGYRFITLDEALQQPGRTINAAAKSKIRVSSGNKSSARPVAVVRESPKELPKEPPKVSSLSLTTQSLSELYLMSAKEGWMKLGS